MVSKSTKLALWWRQGGTRWRLALLVILATTLLFQVLPTQQADLDENAWSGNSFLVFLTVNLNVTILLVLGFLVGRNVVKLVFDRRRNILGSRLRQRLVLAFVGLALIPTSFLFLLANGLLTSTMEDWFGSQVEGAVTGAVGVARVFHRGLVDKERNSITRLVAEIEKARFKNNDDQRDFFEKRRIRKGLFSLRVYFDQKMILEVENAAGMIETFKEPPIAGERLVLTEREGASQFIRAYSLATLQGKSVVLITSRRLPPEITEAIETINDSYKGYEQLKVFRSPLKSGYVLTLAMITGLIIFAAIWIGFYIARDISIPIQKIAEGTQQIAKGNYGFQIRVSGNDELSYLARSFNQMTRDLRLSTEMAEDRRLFIETVLEHLIVGVVALDKERAITSINDAAIVLLGIGSRQDAVGKDLSGLLEPEVFKQVGALIEQANTEKEEEGQGEEVLVIRSEGRERQIICTSGRLENSAKQWIGTLLLFDDVTELSKAQQMSAWREVARRIAHEIKNPLTPIQLSAQRLERMVKAADPPEVGALSDCVETIVQNVDSIKRLANEFSHFARLPTAEPVPSNLNSLIADTVAAFAANHAQIVFQFLPDDKLPLVSMDKEQIRRMVMNLVDNAIAAVDEARLPEGGRIILRTNYDRKHRLAMLEIADNGTGIPDAAKGRIFDPYFTTKKSGTGIGLAIVTTIVNDHQGSIRVYDNQPRGTKFIVELALQPSISMTQRRIGLSS